MSSTKPIPLPTKHPICNEGLWCSKHNCLVHNIRVSNKRLRRDSDGDAFVQRQVEKNRDKDASIETVEFEAVVNKCENPKFPVQLWADGAALKLFASVCVTTRVYPKERQTINCGVRVKEWPKDCIGHLTATPSDAANHGIVIQPSILDSNFRGIIEVTLFNFGYSVFEVEPRQLIAQLAFVKCVRPCVQSMQMFGTDMDPPATQPLDYFRSTDDEDEGMLFSFNSGFYRSLGL